MIKYSLCFLLSLFLLQKTFSQTTRYDTTVYNTDSTKATKMMAYPVGDRVLLYEKPKPFAFVTKLPRTFVNVASGTFQKKSLPVLGAIAATSLILIHYDQHITDGVQQFSHYIGLSNANDYKSGVSFNLGSTKIHAYDVPQNFNSVLYSIGEGSTTMVICAGLSAYGRIKNDYRARQTSSQILQSQLALGIISQLLKRACGRESPATSTAAGGVWRPFTNWSDYQKQVSHYDAFPSGHLATMMATLVVVADNYPEKKWIKPVGYTLMGLTGFAMINNGVHWAGDYPLALGIGYICGKVAVKMNRKVLNRAKRK